MQGVIGNRKDYTAKPQVFLSFSAVRFYSANPNCRAYPELGIYDDMPYLTIETESANSTAIQNYDVLLFCSDGKNCLIPQKADLQSWRAVGFYGLSDMWESVTGNRTRRVNTAFPYFLDSPPKYVGLGINYENSNGGYNYSITNVSSKHLEIQVTAPHMSRIYRMYLQVLLSNWGILFYIHFLNSP